MSDLGLGTRIWRAIMANFWLKLISLTVSLGFFAFIHGEQRGERTVAVSLLVEKPAAGVQRKLMSDLPASVDVKVVGPFDSLQRLRPDDLSIVLNLQAAQSIPDLQLLPEMINGLPPRMSVERVSPEHLVILFEQIVTKPIRVRVEWKGEPDKGLEVVGKVAIEPTSIDATGIDSEVSSIQFARAARFDVSGLTKGKHTRKLKLDAAPPGVSWSQAIVEATVEVSRKMATREFSNISVEVVGFAGAQTRPREVTVSVTGPLDQIEALRENAIVPRVEPRKSGEDLSEPGSAEMPVIVDIPNVTVTVVPARVIVKW
jgi:hypothetical protein